MVSANAIQQILSSPGAIAQGFDGDFLVLTNEEIEFSAARIEIPPYLITPYFFQGLSGHSLMGSSDPKPEQPLRIFKNCLRFKRNELVEELHRSLHGELPQPEQLLWEPPNPMTFLEDFQHIQDCIQKGELEKAVLMTQEQSPWSPNPKERLLLLANLLQRAPAHLWIYGHWDQTSGVLGATPEFLFHRKDQHIESMALAGTLPKSKGQTGALLLEDPKERLEHQLVVDDLTEKLESFVKTLPSSTFSLQLNGPKVLELPHLYHLYTQITGTLDGTHVPSMDLALIKHLHPSSALGLRSCSQQKTWKWLQTLHGHQDIGYFGAPFGILSPNNYCFVLVGIRNIQWNSTESKIGAGCGIVGQSNRDKEWRELEAKRNSVKALLGLHPSTF